jgi:hypothetical protein
MGAILVQVAVDHSYRAWNGPVDLLVFYCGLRPIRPAAMLYGTLCWREQCPTISGITIFCVVRSLVLLANDSHCQAGHPSNNLRL